MIRLALAIAGGIILAVMGLCVIGVIGQAWLQGGDERRRRDELHAWTAKRRAERQHATPPPET